MTRTLALVTAAALLAGCQQKPAAGNGEPAVPEQLTDVTPPAAVAEPPSSGIVAPLPPLSATSTCTSDPVGVTAASELRWVNCRIDVTGAKQSSEVALEFMAPGNLAYERRTMALSGSPYEPQHLDFELAVAGTMIDFGRMYGTWSANFFLDGQPLAAASFEVTP